MFIDVCPYVRGEVSLVEGIHCKIILPCKVTVIDIISYDCIGLYWLRYCFDRAAWRSYRCIA